MAKIMKKKSGIPRNTGSGGKRSLKTNKTCPTGY